MVDLLPCKFCFSSNLTFVPSIIQNDLSFHPAQTTTTIDQALCPYPWSNRHNSDRNIKMFQEYCDSLKIVLVLKSMTFQIVGFFYFITTDKSIKREITIFFSSSSIIFHEPFTSFHVRYLITVSEIGRELENLKCCH